MFFKETLSTVFLYQSTMKELRGNMQETWKHAENKENIGQKNFTKASVSQKRWNKRLQNVQVVKVLRSNVLLCNEM